MTAERIRSTEALLHRLKAMNDRLSTKYQKEDLRLAMIGLPGNALHSYLLHWAMAEYTITHRSWWREAYQRDEPTANDMEALLNLESMTKHATFVFFFSRIEWCFRKLITYLHPGACGHGSDAFKNIYEFLLSRLDQREYIPLYHLCRNIRNAVHSNGVFISRGRCDESVTWRGTSYIFRHMAPIDFMTHDATDSLYSDLIDSIESVLNTPAVSSPTFIEDKIH